MQPPDILRLFLEDEDFVPGGVLVRRDVLEAVGGGDDAFRDAYEDALVHTKICLSWPVYVSSRSWYRYRQHPAAASKIAIANDQVDDERRMYLQWVDDHFIREGVTDPRVWHSLSRARGRYERPLRYRLSAAWRSAKYAESWRQLGFTVGRRLLPGGVRARLVGATARRG